MLRPRAIVIDDEPLGRKRIRSLLARDNRIDVIAECADGASAVEAVRAMGPDLIFLDIQMPVMDGFGVLRAIPATDMPHVIFVTAYDEYAIRAFEVNAIDYLLKPLHPERLRLAIDRTLPLLQLHHIAASVPDMPRSDPLDDDSLRHRILQMLRAEPPVIYPERLVLRVNRDAVFLQVKDIEWIEASGNYVRIHTPSGEYVQRDKLRDLEARLDPKTFIRVHRSAIVNLDAVVRVETWFRGEYRVVLRDDTRLTTSRAHSAAFRALLRD